MLTKSAIKRVQYTYIVTSIFCIFPLDWDPKTRSFSFTKKRIKYWINRLYCYGSPCGMAFLVVSMGVDLAFNYNQIPSQAIVLNLFLLVAGCVISFAALVGNHDWWAVAYEINNVIRTDQHLQDTLLTKAEIKKFQKKPSLLVFLSNIFEPISIIHSILVSMLFFEEYDLFHRYVFNYFKIFLHFDTFWHKIPFSLMYMGFVRIMYGYLIIMSITLAAHYESTSFWLEQLGSNPKFLKLPFDQVFRVFQLQQILFVQLKNSNFLNMIVVPAATAVFTALVICTYCTFAMFNTLNIYTYLAMPSIAVLLYVLVRMLCFKAGGLKILCEQFLVMKMMNATKSPHIKNCLQSSRPMVYMVFGNVEVGPEAFKTFMSSVFDNTINCLMM